MRMIDRLVSRYRYSMYIATFNHKIYITNLNILLFKYDIFTVPFNESYFVLRTEYKQASFLETRQVKAYDMNSLVGNVGGYIGMFLGYALLNVPNILNDFLQKIVKNESKQQISSVNAIASK